MIIDDIKERAYRQALQRHVNRGLKEVHNEAIYIKNRDLFYAMTIAALLDKIKDPDVLSSIEFDLTVRIREIEGDDH